MIKQTCEHRAAITAQQTYWITSGPDASNDTTLLWIHSNKLCLNLHYVGLKLNYKQHNDRLSVTSLSGSWNRSTMFLSFIIHQELGVLFDYQFYECLIDSRKLCAK